MRLRLIRKLTAGWSPNMAALDASIGCFRPHGQLRNVRAIREGSLNPAFSKKRHPARFVSIYKLKIINFLR